MREFTLYDLWQITDNEILIFITETQELIDLQEFRKKYTAKHYELDSYEIRSICINGCALQVTLWKPYKDMM